MLVLPEGISQLSALDPYGGFLEWGYQNGCLIRDNSTKKDDLGSTKKDDLGVPPWLRKPPNILVLMYFTHQSRLQKVVLSPCFPPILSGFRTIRLIHWASGCRNQASGGHLKNAVLDSEDWSKTTSNRLYHVFITLYQHIWKHITNDLKLAPKNASKFWSCPMIFRLKPLKFFGFFQDFQPPKLLGNQASVQFAASLAS